MTIYYQRRDLEVPPEINIWGDTSTLTAVELQDEVDAYGDIQALDDDAITILIEGTPLTVEMYREMIQQEIDQRKDLIDFFDYEKTDVVLSVADADWFTPVSVEDFCGEEVGHEAVLTIDELNNTYWQHDTDHEHEITWKLREYKKRISKLQVRVGSSSRNLLTDVDVYIADDVALLGTPGALVTTFDLTVPNSWEEVTWGPGKKNGRWIRFAGFKSQHANNEVRIQEVQMRVVTVEYDV